MYKSLEQIIREVAIWGEVSPGPDFAVLSEESEVKLQEGGHDDVSSMKTKVEIGLKAFEKMKAALEKLPDEGSIPTWWTNKVATAVARIDDMSDYLDTKMNGEKDEE